MEMIYTNLTIYLFEMVIFHNYHSVFRQQDLMEATKKSWLCIVFQKTLTAVVPSPSALMFCLSTHYQG